MNVELPLDNGFLRRQCPNCNEQFKWHSGPVDGAPDSALEEDPTYYCPLCGQPGASDAFWTDEQLQFLPDAVAPGAHQLIQDALLDALRDKKHMRFEPGDLPPHPSGLYEPEDMVEVQSPCHPWEPVKVPEDWSERLHCLVCGAPYAV